MHDNLFDEDVTRRMDSVGQAYRGAYMSGYSRGEMLRVKLGAEAHGRA